MLTLGSIIGNIRKGQSAIKVRSILSKLEQQYQRMKSSMVLTGCKKEASKVTIYLTTPSSSAKGVVYDTVIELHTTNHMTMNTPFKVYSNSPFFLYNFSFVFGQQGSLLFPNLVPNQFKEMSPQTRNPFLFVGFSKDVFSAIRYIGDYGLNNIITALDGTIPQVKSFDDKVRELRDVRGSVSNG